MSWRDSSCSAVHSHSSGLPGKKVTYTDKCYTSIHLPSSKDTNKASFLISNSALKCSILFFTLWTSLHSIQETLLRFQPLSVGFYLPTSKIIISRGIYVSCFFLLLISHQHDINITDDFFVPWVGMKIKLNKELES